VLNLVTNPVGAFLPPARRRERLDTRAGTGRYGILFDHLFTITNMPISRFLQHLDERGQTETYLARWSSVSSGRGGQGDVPYHALGGRAAGGGH
jgi:uncharacterized protein DUF3641